MIGNHVPAKNDGGAKSSARLPWPEHFLGPRGWLTCGSAGRLPWLAGPLLLRPLDQQGRAGALEDIHQDDLPAAGGDDFVADHLLARIVATLHKHTRLDPRNQVQRRIFLENDDEIDRFKCGKYLGACT